MSQYYPAGKSSINPLKTLESSGQPQAIPNSQIILVNPNTSYYGITTIYLANNGHSYPLTTTASISDPEHPDGTACSLSLKFGLTKASLLIDNAGSNHYEGDVYYIYNSTEDNIPAVLMVTEVGEDGSIIDFEINQPGSDFDNNGIVVVHNYQKTFEASFIFIPDNFCIANCTINDSGTGYALLDSRCVAIERPLILSNYGSGVGLEAYAFISPFLDSNNNIIYPSKTHSSNPSAQNIFSVRPVFTFDHQSMSWKALNNENVNESQPKCSSNSIYTVGAIALAGALITLKYGFKLIKQYGLEQLAQQQRKEDAEYLLFDSLSEQIKKFLQGRISKGLVGNSSVGSSTTRTISELIELDPRYVFNDGVRTRAWPSPYYFPQNVTIDGQSIPVDVNTVYFDDNPIEAKILEELRKHRESHNIKMRALCEIHKDQLREETRNFIKQLRKTPGFENIFNKFDSLKVKEVTSNIVDIIERQLLTELENKRISGAIGRSEFSIYEKAIKDVCARVKARASSIRLSFTGKTAKEISETVIKKKKSITFKFPTLKRNANCSRLRGGTSGTFPSVLFMMYALSSDYARSETEEDLVNNVVSTLLAEFQLVPDGCSEVDRPSPEKSFGKLIDNLEYLMKKYYLGNISQQELIDEFSASIDPILLNNIEDGSDISNQLIELIDLINEGDLKGLADDVANQTEWPADFSFPWNLDRQVIKERTERSKHLKFALFLKEQMIDPFSETTQCSDLCGSGSSEEYFSLEQFIESEPSLIDEIPIGLILQLESDIDDSIETSLNEFYK